MSRPGSCVNASSGDAARAAARGSVEVAMKVPKTLRPPRPTGECIRRPPASISPLSMNTVRPGDAEIERLPGPRACGAIPLAGSGRGEQRVALRRTVDAQPELVAADDAARRMDHDGVAHALAFRVERLLHDQWAVVLSAAKHRTGSLGRKTEREAGLPRCNNGLGQAHPKIIPPAGA